MSYYDISEKNYSKEKNSKENKEGGIDTLEMPMPPQKPLFVRSFITTSNTNVSINSNIHKGIKSTYSMSNSNGTLNSDVKNIEVIQLPLPPLPYRESGRWRWGWGTNSRRRILRRRRRRRRRILRGLSRLMRIYPRSIYEDNGNYYFRSRFAPIWWPRALYYNGYIPLVEPWWWYLYYSEPYPSVENFFNFMPRGYLRYRSRRYPRSYGVIGPYGRRGLFGSIVNQYNRRRRRMARRLRRRPRRRPRSRPRRIMENIKDIGKNLNQNRSNEELDKKIKSNYIDKSDSNKKEMSKKMQSVNNCSTMEIYKNKLK